MAFRKPAKAKARLREPNVTGSDYDPETRELTVTFRSGKRYRYSDVEADKADEFRNSKSQGSYLHKHIAGICSHCILDD